MKKKILIAFLFINFVLFSGSAMSQESIKVLVITGKHDYNRVAFNEMLDSYNGMDCTIKEMGEKPGALFEKPDAFPFDAIVLYNFHQLLSEQQKKNFIAILKSGVGLTVIHHALIGFPDWIEYENIIGATYVSREQTRSGKHFRLPTWKHGIDMKIKIEELNHPITRGIEDFTIHDETYKHWVYHDENHLLLSTNNEYSNFQIAWTRMSLGTRVFVIQLGHDEYAFENENYRKLLQQGVIWTVEK